MRCRRAKPMNNPTPSSTPPASVIVAEATQPLDKIDEVLRESFAKDIVDQAARLDDLAKQLITLEIAVPGAYAAILKLASGEAATLSNPWLSVAAFIAWFAALGLTLLALIPLRRQVDPDSLTDIQNYFTDSAARKLRCVIPASVLTLLGIGLAVLATYIK